MPPSQFAQRLIADVGPVDGYLHVDPVLLSTPTVVKSNKFDIVNKYEPWAVESSKNILDYHPAAVWRALSVRISSREGCFGRMVNLYCGWSNSGAPAPTTLREMAALKGKVIRTFGGTGDPGMFNMVVDCPFDGAMSDVLKTTYNEGIRAVFYYCFTETNLTADPPKAPRVMLEFDGHFDVYGRF